jgi:hypothetical protein
MNKTLKGILIDVENEEVKCIEIQDTLDEYYRILNCDTIDIVSRKIGRKRFEIVCDDEGTFKENPKISAIDNYGSPQFVGNLFIVGGEIDEEGNLTGLKQSEVAYVMDRIQKMYTRRFINGYPMLTQCEY